MKSTFTLPDSDNMFYFYMLSEQYLVHTKEINIPMESKLNQAAVEEYSAGFSQKLIPRAFEHKERLSGQDILSLTPLKQVNLLVVKEIFLRWKAEVEQLKSPYFDYQASEVRSALDDFMNVVSQHISVDQQHIHPLLKKAVQDTLYLVLAPYDFYFQMLSVSDKSAWPVKDLEEILKYMRINRPLLEKLTEKCRKEGSDSVSKEHVIELFKEVAGHLDEAPEDTEPYIRQFNEVIYLDINDLYSGEIHTNAHNTSFFDTLDTPPEPKEEASEKPDKEDGPRTLNDRLNQPGRFTLADEHQKRKIEKLARHISVNQKFMFIRELFDNDAQAFASAVDKLDAQQTYAEAVNLIRQDFAQDYRWKMDSEEVLEFMELISKRF